MEILLGIRNYGTAIDMWGVGCVIAELFTGRPILQGGRPHASDSDNDLDQFIQIAKVGCPVTSLVLTGLAVWVARPRQLGGL